MIFDSFGITILYIGIILLFAIHKFVSPVARYKQVLLLLANILVLSYLIPLFTILTTAVVASLCYAAAFYFQRNDFNSSKQKRAWLGLLCCLLILVFWWVLLKYNGPKDYLRSSHLLGTGDINRFISAIGLSYMFFKLIHVLVDTYRGRLKNLDPVTFLNYLFFFPTYISGPIDRYQNFCRWIGGGSRRNQGLLFRAAFFRIFEGVVKKFIFVPLLIGYAKDFGQVHLSNLFLVNMAISLIAYSFYLFFDFSGYSDLAIGVAMLLGFKVPENFKSPYLSRNIAEFWKRWHISLSSVLREYIFLPLVRGISKHFVRVPRLVGTLGGYLTTFLICGLWHGNTLNFVFWGLWHGIGLSVHKLWCVWITENSFLKEHVLQKWRLGNRKFAQAAITVFSVGITFCYVSLGWLFFNYSVDQIRSVQEIAKLRMVAQPYYFYGKSFTWGVRLKYSPLSIKDKIDVDLRTKGEGWVHYAQNITTRDKVLNIYGIKNKAVVNSEISYNNLAPGQYELRLHYRKGGKLKACRIIIPVTIPDYSKHANLNADDLEAKACRIADAGWGIKLKYHPPSRGTKVDIEYRPLGSKLWVRYQHQQPGRYQITHIVK
ncbi:MAG TPA: hypothetical protein DDW50_19250, partial [Firmicutes bacterium]|nr:hypothetical protein [Bacillota bacterium]